MDVAAWLRMLGLERYEATFRENSVAADLLPSLTAEDLKELGITAVGHRRRLLDAIAALRADTKLAGDLTADEGRADEIDPRQSLRPTAERRQVSVMFCDLVGSTELSARLDPEDLGELIRPYQRRVAETIGRFNGFIAKYMGDGVLVYFGWPIAGEADAEQAVRAALAAVETVSAMPVQGEALRVRIGIATGMAVVGDPIGTGVAFEHTIIGETPNLAARLQALANANGIIIDIATRRQLGGLFECRDLGELQLKGFPEPVRAWQVLGERMVESRFEALHADTLTPMIGRGVELDLLVERWRKAKEGAGQVIVVAGEAGIGKSRLIAALEESLEGEAPTCLRYFCSPHHTDAPLHPVITSMQNEAGFARGDTDAERLHKLQLTLGSTLHASAETALIAEMLSVPMPVRPQILDPSARVRKEKTFDALIGRLRQLALTNPLLVILEDAHWADASSIELFGAMIHMIREIPALLIVSMRGDDSPTWIGLDGVDTLRLAHLNRQQAAVLAASITTGGRLPPELLDRIVDQTDGVPLFVEELTKMVLETSSVGVPDGTATAPFSVPPTLQASLAARLDRIAAGKDVAQVAAVFGREFSHAQLTAVAGLSQPVLLHGLRQLVNAGLASHRGTPPEATYTFKHALVRDTAYGMLLRSRRRELHARAVAALEDQSPELREQQPELLAHHYSQAGLVEPAITYWAKAGSRSVARSAMVEAAAQLRQAIELIPALPEGAARLRQELELQGTLGGALFALQAWGGGAVQAYTRALELAEQLGDVEAMIPAFAGLVTYHIGQCQYCDARAIAVKLLGIAERTNESIVQLIAHRCMGVCLHWTGEFAGALGHFDRVLSLYDPARHRQLATIFGFDVAVQAAILSCWDLLLLGHPDQALARFYLAGTRLCEVDHKHSRVFALGYGGIFCLFMHDHERAFRQLTDAVELATEQNFAAWVGTSNVVLGSVFTAPRDCAQGLALTQAGYAKYTAAVTSPNAGTGLVLNTTYYLALLAHAFEAAGVPADAGAYLDAAIDAAEQCGERWFEPELHRLKGEWLLRYAPGNKRQAEAAFTEAIDRAVRQNARFWELRAAISLAQLYVGLGQPRRARATLAPIYEWFSEGLDQPELRRAGALLASLPT